MFLGSISDHIQFSFTLNLLAIYGSQWNYSFVSCFVRKCQISRDSQSILSVTNYLFISLFSISIISVVCIYSTTIFKKFFKRFKLKVQCLTQLSTNTTIYAFILFYFILKFIYLLLF